MNRKSAIFLFIICLLLTLGSAALQAFSMSNLSNENKSETMSVTLGKLKEERTKLIEAQAEVVTQANDAKIRVEKILKQSITDKKALSADQLEGLKKDLEVIKFNQEILNTILADIRAAALEQDDLLPSKEYIDKLTELYTDKTNQLNEVAKALQGVAAESK